jgi:hypothetical protein
MSSPTPDNGLRGDSGPPAILRAPRHSLRWACLGALVLGLGVARAADEEAFFAHYKGWTKMLKASPAKMAPFIHFPLLVDGHPFTEDQFGKEAAGARGLFSKGMRERLRAVPVDEIQSFEDRAGFDAVEGGCPDLPAVGPVFEVDVESDHGGPARRFIFGGEAVGYRLYCVSRP